MAMSQDFYDVAKRIYDNSENPSFKYIFVASVGEPAYSINVKNVKNVLYYKETDSEFEKDDYVDVKKTLTNLDWNSRMYRGGITQSIQAVSIGREGGATQPVSGSTYREIWTKTCSYVSVNHNCSYMRNENINKFKIYESPNSNNTYIVGLDALYEGARPPVPTQTTYSGSIILPPINESPFKRYTAETIGEYIS